ncbi:MAG TPA: hypothetical protein VM735_13260 [Candidatus Kapabacteria bacterium]|nr:hypothetical protein [Candidatus Kapabacteria bacterium]
MKKFCLKGKLGSLPPLLRAAVCLVGTFVSAFAGPIHAGKIYVPNASFESPRTEFADPRIDAWQKAPEPAWYQGGGGFPWDQLVGQFLNTPAGSSNHIENLDGSQAAFLFALPDVAIFRDYNSLSGANSAPSHEFNAVYEAGKSYALTVAVLGGAVLTNGATFEISLYYRDAASNMVTVASTTVTNSTGLFPTNTLFIDFQARTPIVKATDAWFGKQIGIRLASTVGFDRQGGYWDVDNVRLTENLLPNNSFESPDTDFADPRIDSWQKTPEPAWYQGGGGFPWDQLMGQFLNTSRGSSNHIDNVDGEQGVFLFALPDVAIFQDETTLTGKNTSSSFTAKYEVGKSYALTVALLGGGGGMTNGATFEISLYYRDVASNIVTIAATRVTNTQELFPTNTHFLDFQARTPIVHETNGWAGKNIGVRLASTVGFELQGGYWDVDNVRITESVVPNGSFEAPDTDFADPRMDNWQKAPEPAWYQGGGGFPWDQLIGQFLNTPRGESNHIDNFDGEQGAFLFALPDVAISQEFAPLHTTNTALAPDFNGTYEVGKAYAMTVAVLGGSGGMTNGATLELSFYYRDSASNAVIVASTTITNSTSLFPTNTHFTDFRVAAPTVADGADWAGKPIGIRLASTVGFDRQGGYWDIDNVRVEITQAPILSTPAVNSGQFQLTLESPHGRYEVLSTPDITATGSTWTNAGTITNTTGRATFVDPNSSVAHRFYQVRSAP